MMVRPPTTSRLLSRPPNRRARPPARIAAATSLRTPRITCMIDAHVGRLLAATLHEAIADELPQRLEFYEEWLRGQGMRDGSIGLAPISAVLGFLRTEGDAYDRVVSRAGSMAADWSVAALSPFRRRTGIALPRPFRTRAAFGIV